MILKAPAVKKNGLSGGGFWYITRDEKDEITASLNRNKAHNFTKQEAIAWNKRHMENGSISSPFIME